MATRANLPTNWEKAFRNPAGVWPILEVIIDPAYQNIKFGGLHDVASIGSIIHGFEPNIDNIFKLSLKDLSITFNDPDEFFAPGSLRGGFKPYRRIMRVLDESTANNPVTLRDGLQDFVVNDMLIFAGNGNKELSLVTAVSGNELSFSGLVHTYQAGDIVATAPITGKEILVQLKLDGESEKLELYRGIVRKPFAWDGASGQLQLDNKMMKAFDREMRIHATSVTPISRINTSGSLASTLTWSTGATGTCSDVTVYTGARLGLWTITFSDATNFTVSGPNCKDKAGTTGNDFYDQTDTTDSQIKIASTAWGGTPATDDILTFYVSANFENKTMPEIIYEILNDYGEITDLDVGGTGVTDIAELSYSFNLAYNCLSGETIDISFDKSLTIGQAIASVLPHQIGSIAQGVQNNLRLIILHPDFKLAEVVPKLIGNPNINPTDIVNEITVYYGWDYSLSSDNFQYNFTYPKHDDNNASFLLHDQKVSKEIMAPGIYSETQAENLAKRIYSIFKNGLFLFDFECTLMNLMTDIGDIADITICNPGVDYNNTLIYKIEKLVGEKNRIKVYSLASSGLQNNEDNAWT